MIGRRRSSPRCGPAPTSSTRPAMSWSTRPRWTAAMAAGHLGGLAPRSSATPSPEVGRHPLLAYPERGDPAPSGRRDRRDAAPRRRDGGGRYRALPGRRPHAERGQPGRPGCPDRAGRRPMSHVLAIDLGTGSCRAVVFDEAGQQVGIGQREWCHAAAPRRARLPGLRYRPQLAPDLRVHARGHRERRRRAVGHRRREQHQHARGMVLYDAAGREIWACPNVDSRVGDPGARARSRPATRASSSRPAATGWPSPRPRGSSGSRSTSRRSSRRSPTWACSATGSSTG